MKNIKIDPSILIGTINVPSSLSIAHKAMFCAAMSDGIEHIIYDSDSEDLAATLGAIEVLGAVVDRTDDGVTITGIYSPDNRSKSKKTRTIDCIESRSTLDMFLPLSAILGGKTKFIGERSLSKTFLGQYYEIFDMHGITYQNSGDILKLELSGKLLGGDINIKGNNAARFLPGMLMSLPLSDQDTKIHVTGDISSTKEIELTLDIMKYHGIEILNDRYKIFYIKGGQRYSARNIKIEGDYAYASFFLTCGALGSDITIEGLETDTLQSSKYLIDVLMKMGAKMIKGKTGIKIKGEGLKKTTLDAALYPDAVPFISVIGALSSGDTEIINIQKIKNTSDNIIDDLLSELFKLGIKIDEKDNSLLIYGNQKIDGGVELWSHHDPRIAMALIASAMKCSAPVVIRECQCIAKEYPRFFDDLIRLGGKIDEAKDVTEVQ